MAAERKPTQTAREKRLEKAFRRFVELIEPIEDVHYVVAFDEGDLDVFAYITKRDRAVSQRVHEAEFKVLDEFEDLSLNFHVVYLEGRDLESFVRPLPSLKYSKAAEASSRQKAS